MLKSLINFLAILSILVPSAAAAGGVPSNDASFHSKIAASDGAFVIPLGPSSRLPGIPLTGQKLTADRRVCIYGKRYSMIVASNGTCPAAGALAHLGKRVK